MEIRKDIHIAAPATTVWRIIGENFGSVDVWAGMVETSRFQLSQSGEQVGSKRVCTVSGMGEIRETLTAYSNKNMQLSYQVSGMPFFVRRAGSEWRVSPAGEQACVVHMQGRITLLPVIGWLMLPIMQYQWNRFAEGVLEELKYFAETGVPHPRKQAALDKKTPATATAAG